MVIGQCRNRNGFPNLLAKLAGNGRGAIKKKLEEVIKAHVSFMIVIIVIVTRITTCLPLLRVKTRHFRRGSCHNVVQSTPGTKTARPAGGVPLIIDL